jgi:hypothetical protein
LLTQHIGWEPRIQSEVESAQAGLRTIDGTHRLAATDAG